MAHDLEKKWRSKDVLVLENVDFSSMLLCDRVLAGLTKAGFKKPSPIQLEAIPLGRFGNDLLVQAKSGTGKTLVFVIVALEMLERKNFHPQVLILVPTREIATQICSVIKSVGSYFPKLTCECFIGGFPVADDVKKAHNCQIVVGTPGRLKQLIEMKALKMNSIRLAVFDEADEVLSFSWLEDIDFIFNSMNKSKQVIATSATYPQKLQKIIVKYLRDPRLVQIDTKKLTLLGIIHYIKVVESSAMPIKQYQFKLAALGVILKSIKFTQCLVYCNGIHKVETLYKDIKKWGFSTTYISSNRDQADRLRAIDNLKRFKCKVLVSSNVTARGIDAENVDLVINFDVSNHTEIYLHRSGRAGRYGTKGATISLVDRFELKYIEKVEKEAQFKSYELPDPVPTDLIQNPVLDNYVIDEVATILENSNEDQSKMNPEVQSLSINGNYCASIVNSEQCDNQSNNLFVTTTDNDVNDSRVVNRVTADVKSSALMKENSENSSLNDVENKNNCESCSIIEESNDSHTYVKAVDKSGKRKKSKQLESNSYISHLKNGNTDDVSTKNLRRPDSSNDTEKSIIVNKHYDNENAQFLAGKEDCLAGSNGNSSILNIKESSPDCEIPKVVNVKNTRKKLVDGSKNSGEFNVIESSLLSANNEVVCVKDLEDNLINSDKKSCDVIDKESCSSSTNKPDTEISRQQDCPSKLQANEDQSMNDFGSKNKIKAAVKNYIKEYKNVKQIGFQDEKDSSEFKIRCTEKFDSRNISLNHIRDLNSKRSEYYYKVFKHFQEVKLSTHSERVREVLKKDNISSANKENGTQESIPCSEISPVVIYSSNNTVSELYCENVNELQTESSLQVPDAFSQEKDSEDDDTPNNPKFYESPVYESTPQLEKNKSKDMHLLDSGSSEKPERNVNIKSAFEEVSDDSTSEIESYYETSQSNPYSLSSLDSESDSNSCTDSSSSNDSISSSSDEDSTETSSSESQSSVDSLSVHSIEYSCGKDMKGVKKYPQRTVSKQEKASLKKHPQRCAGRADQRQQYFSKTHQNTNHTSDFYKHAEGVNYSGACGTMYHYCHSNVNQASSNSQNFQSKKSKNLHQSNNIYPFVCNGQHNPACFMPSEHRCHAYHDSLPCDQRAICDQWYRIFCYQWQHIQNSSRINY